MAQYSPTRSESSDEDFGLEVRTILEEVEQGPSTRFKMEKKRPVRTVHVSFDYGTTKVAVAFWIGFPGTQPLDSEICDVSFGSHASSPQKVAFIDGKCYQGHGLDAMLREGDVKQEEVIDYLKVLFYKSHATSELAVKALAQLREHAGAFGLKKTATADELRTHALALQLEDLMEHVEEAIRSNGEQHFSISPKEIKACPRKIFISVPGMWTPPGNRCITEAAKRAGFENVHLVFEPQAAAAYWLQKIKPTKSGVYKPGDRIQVLDVGGGTSDAIGYEVREATSHPSSADDHNEAATFKLVSMGDATGRLCGSEFINLAFLRWLPKHVRTEHLRKEWGFAALRRDLEITQAELNRHIDTEFIELKHANAEQIQACYWSGMPKMLKDLRLTEAEFMDRANREFGRLKVRLDEREFQDPVQKIFINGKPKSDDVGAEEEGDDDNSAQEDDAPERKILIKKEVLHSFYEPVLQENFELIRDLKKDNAHIKSIIVIGGLRNSSYFMERLEQEFLDVTIVGAANSSVGQPHPVARGALWAFSIVQPQSLICTDSYGIEEDQELHAIQYGDAHHDLIDDSVGIVKGELEPEIEYAVSRWRTAVKPGLPDMRTERTSLWQLRHIVPSEEDIWLSIYWSASERNEHSRIFKNAERTELIEGVEEFACLKSKLPDLVALGFELRYVDKKLATMHRKAADEEADDGDFTGDSDYEPSRPSARSRKRPGRSVGSRAKKNKPVKKKNKPTKNSKPSTRRCKNCKNCGGRIEDDPDASPTHCDSCSKSACYKVHTRLIVETTGANIRVRWEMMANSRKSDDVDNEDIDSRDLHVLHDDAVVQSAFSPIPIM